MSEIIKFAKENDEVSARQIRQGQKALSAVQGVVAGPGIRAAYRGGVLSIGLDGLPTANRSGFMAEILDYDSTEKRYSFAEAIFTSDTTGEGIAQLLGADPAARHSTDQYVAVEITGNVSVPIGAYVMVYPTMGTENGESLFVFAYGAVVMYCKISDDTAGAFEANPCAEDGSDPNTDVDISISEPLRGRLFFEVDDVIKVLVKSEYTGSGPFSIDGDHISDHAPRYITELFKITSPTAVVAADNGPGDSTTEWTYTASAVEYNSGTGAYDAVSGYLQSKAALNTLEAGNRSVSTGSGTFGNGVTYDMLCTDGTGDDPYWTGKLLSVPANKIVTGQYDPVGNRVFFTVPNGIDGECTECPAP